MDEELQGTGRGGSLCADAILQAYKASRLSGAKLLVLDSIDEDTAQFYKRMGFRPSSDDPLRMWLVLEDVGPTLSHAAMLQESALS